jgi:superfamily II DNA/RNA helicase
MAQLVSATHVIDTKCAAHAGVGAGAEIEVACPDCLLDLMEQRAIDLKSIEILVLDEADRISDMGFCWQSAEF